jgi:hypothetical protein
MWPMTVVQGSGLRATRGCDYCQAVRVVMAQERVPPSAERGTDEPRGNGATRDGSVGRRERASDLIVELALFMSSYAPLFAILAVRFRSTGVIVACAALSAAGFAAGAAVLVRFHQVTGSTWTVRTVEDRGGEVAGYLATYLLPFVTVSEPGVRDVVGYALFLMVVAVIYVRSSLVQINPTLYLFGWRLYAIEIGDGWSGYLLARGPVRGGTDFAAVRMTERLFVSYSSPRR